MTDDTERPGPPGIRVGAVVLAIGGMSWWVAAATQTSAVIPILLLGLLAAVALLWYGWRQLPDDGESELFRATTKRYNLLNLAQVVAIVLVVLLCGSVAQAPWLIPGCIAIVNGAHFLPLGRWFAQPAYARLGLVIAAIGVLGIVLGASTQSVPRTLLVVGVCVAVAMWTVPFSRLLQRAQGRHRRDRTFHLDDLDRED